MTPYKIQVRIGPHEFTAEGDAGDVRADYQDFLARIQQGDGYAAATNGVMAERVGSNQLTSDELARLFRVDGDVVSLSHLPNTGTRLQDGLIVTLLGFETQLGVREVGASALIESARISGLGAVDRLDRVFGTHREFINVGGARRGTRYSLNNRGRTYATEVARGMLL